MKRILRRLFRRKSPERLPPYITVGRGTYGVTRAAFQGISPEVPVSFGNYCSIAVDAEFLCHAGHPTHLVSTYPFRTLLFSPDKGNQDAVSRGPITIGHDVWIGARVLIFSGVTIGSGAIIGAGAVVTRDVPPYGVVVGNPGRVARLRFDPEIIAALLEIAWWDWPEDRLQSAGELFYGDPRDFVAAVRAGRT